MTLILEYKLDVVAFVFLATIATIALLVRLRRKHNASQRSRYIVLMASTLVIVGGTLLADVFGNHERDQLVSAVSGFAPTYAMEFDRAGGERVTLDTPADDPTYLSLIDLQTRWLASNPTVADIYTYRVNKDGQLALCVDSETDYDHSGKIDDEREERTAIGELYDGNADSVQAAFNGVASFDSQITNDRWGTWVSAVEPVRNANGTVYAVLGVDFPAQEWVQTILRARGAMLLISAITLAILLSTSYMVTSLQSEVERRREAEAASRAMQDRLRTIVDNEPECVVVLDRDGVILEINPAGQRLLGAVSASTLVGHNFREFVHPKQSGHYDAHAKQICDGASDVIEVQINDATGASRAIWLETHSVPLRDSATGHVTGMLSVGRDVTQRKRAEAEKEELQRQLLDASRQAGMAEIATGVLHNVGNVLNSVNVSTQLLVDRIAGCRVGSLGKLAELLREQQPRLGEFVTNDDRGKRLPDFVEQLYKKMADDQATFGVELKSLADGIAHIKEIVRMQQDCAARPSTVIAPLKPTDVMEEALRVNVVSMERHEIQVTREYQDLDALPLDKHKILQILINLISNSKQATCSPGILHRHITLRVKLNDDGSKVRFEVADNGTGMTPDVMAKLFRHGFTTRKDGHGFGLHSAANAAREMGGELFAASDGPNQGSTFTLQLPTRSTTTSRVERLVA